VLNVNGVFIVLSRIGLVAVLPTRAVDWL